MFKRVLALALFALAPAGTVFALPDAPAQTPPYTIQSSLIDSIAKTGTSSTNTKQALLGYNIIAHDDKYKYTVPLCRDAVLVEVDGRTTDPTDYVPGDSVVMTVRANALADAKICASRIVRQSLGKGTSAGECLQNYQVKHSIQDDPTPVIAQRDYVLNLIVYARPTLECDGQTYGANPITTVVADHAPLIITVSRPTTTGELIELMRWNLTTSSAGKATFQYRFDIPSDKYTFKIMPGSNATPGDVISWDQKVIGQGLAPSPTPPPVQQSGYRFTPAPFIALLIVVLLVVSIMEALRFNKKKRESLTPEEEYQNTPKL